jgi:hypothetical protein
LPARVRTFFFCLSSYLTCTTEHFNYAGYLDEDLHDPVFISILEEAGSARVLVRTKDGAVETVEDKVKQPFSAEAVLGDLLAKRPPLKNAVLAQVLTRALVGDCGVVVVTLFSLRSGG